MLLNIMISRDVEHFPKMSSTLTFESVIILIFALW